MCSIVVYNFYKCLKTFYPDRCFTTMNFNGVSFECLNIWVRTPNMVLQLFQISNPFSRAPNRFMRFQTRLYRFRRCLNRVSIIAAEEAFRKITFQNVPDFVWVLAERRVVASESTTGVRSLHRLAFVGASSFWWAPRRPRGRTDQHTKRQRSPD